MPRSVVDIMKLIVAIIRPGRLEAVQRALLEVEVVRLTVLECQGFARTRGTLSDGPSDTPRGGGASLVRKVELQIAVNTPFVEPTLRAIAAAARSEPDGEIGDGKIFVLPLDDVMRIRTGERGEEAV